MFGFIIVILTLLVAVGAVVLAFKLPPEFQYWRFISGGIAVGLLLSAILYWQQLQAVSRSIQERDHDITEATNRAVYEATQRVSQEVGKRYQQQISSLTKQVTNLESQSSGQENRSDIVGSNMSSSAPAAKGGALPSGPATAAKPSGPTPGIFWIQRDEAAGKGTAEVQFRIYGPLNVPAFIAVCDRPCRAVGGQAGTGSEGIVLEGSSDRDVAGYLFKKPRPMPAGTEGTITLQSSSRESLNVTTFRILRESEVPANLK